MIHYNGGKAQGFCCAITGLRLKDFVMNAMKSYPSMHCTVSFCFTSFPGRFCDLCLLRVCW